MAVSGGTAHVIGNNTVGNGVQRGFRFTAGTIAICQNNISCVSGGFADYTYTVVPTDLGYNLSADATADDAGGSGNLINKTLAAQIQTATAGSENGTLLITADAYHAGIDLSAQFTTDCDGETRVTPWDMGADAYIASAPTVSLCTPASGSTAGGTAVTVTGTLFVTGLTATIGGVALTSVVFVSSTSFTGVTGAHAAGLVDVVVTNPDAQVGTGTNLYTYITPPAPTGVAPGVGTTAGGTSITITGTGFDVAGASVTVAGTACTSVVVVSSTSITCTTGAHAAASAQDIVVTNTASALTGTLAGVYTYAAPPTLTNVSPAHGPTRGHDNTTLTGTGFGTGMVVTFGTGQATAVTASGTTAATLKTPGHAPGTVTVTVTDSNGLSASWSSTYEFKRTISLFLPTGGTIQAPGF